MRRARWLAFAALGLLALAELGLRFGLGLGDPPLVTRDPAAEYRLVPSADYTRFGNRITINRFGMRGPDHPPDASATERRVLLIGDSVVYGNHFLDQSQTIAVQMTTALQALPGLTGCQARAMAAAASSWGPVNQAAYLADIGTLDADLAILIASAHDLYDTPSSDGSLIPYRLRRSFGAVDDALQILTERLKRRWVSGPAAAPAETRQAATLAALDQIAAQLASDDIPMMLAYHPTLPERRKGVRREHQAFADWAAQNDVAFVSLESPALTEETYRDHIHPAAPGAAVISQILADLSEPYLDPCDST